MSSLISDAEKQALVDAMNDVHDTFARDIIVYSESIKEIINPNVNPLFPFPQKDTDINFEDNKQTIKARVLYGRPQSSILTGGAAHQDSVIELPEGWVRIKVLFEYQNLIDNCKRIELDGVMFIKDSHKRGHGLFDSNYLTYFFKPINA